jgi:putative membrane protein
MNFLLRFIITSAIGYLLAWYLPGSSLYRDQAGTLLMAVSVSILNSFIKPAKVTKTYPITIYTLMVVMTIANIFLIKVCDRYIPGFEIHSLANAIVVAAVMSTASLVIDRLVRAD